MAVNDIAHDVCHDEQRQDETDGCFGTKCLRHEHDIERGCPTKPGFGKADAKCGDGCQHEDAAVRCEKGVLLEPVWDDHSTLGDDGNRRADRCHGIKLLCHGIRQANAAVRGWSAGIGDWS